MNKLHFIQYRIILLIFLLFCPIESLANSSNQTYEKNDSFSSSNSIKSSFSIQYDEHDRIKIIGSAEFKAIAATENWRGNGSIEVLVRGNPFFWTGGPVLWERHRSPNYLCDLPVRGREKKIMDYYGAPKELRDLEKQIANLVLSKKMKRVRWSGLTWSTHLFHRYTYSSSPSSSSERMPIISRSNM